MHRRRALRLGQAVKGGAHWQSNHNSGAHMDQGPETRAVCVSSVYGPIIQLWLKDCNMPVALGGPQFAGRVMRTPG